MKWARVENDIVMETTDIDPEGRFTPDIVAQFRECPEEVEQGWTYIDGIWNAPYVDPEPTEDELKKQKLDILNADYSQRLKKLEICFTKPDILLTGTTNESNIPIVQSQIRNQYQSTHAEMITKQGVILNG